MNLINGYSYGKDREAWLMIWDTNPKSFGKETEIKVNSKVEINKDDLIQTGIDDNFKGYKCIEILNQRPSTMNNMTYYTLRAKRVLNID